MKPDMAEKREDTPEEKLAWKFQAIMSEHLRIEEDAIMGVGQASFAMARQVLAASTGADPVVTDEMVERGVIAMVATLGKDMPEGCPTYQHAVVRAALEAAALSAAPLPLAGEPVAQDGWKLVPVEPTEVMLEAGVEATGIRWGFGQSDATIAYHAMLSAAGESPPTTTGHTFTLANSGYAAPIRNEDPMAEGVGFRERFNNLVDYSCDLQRIIEGLCSGGPIPEPHTSARHHYTMAVNALPPRALKSDAVGALEEALKFYANTANWVAGRWPDEDEKVDGLICVGRQEEEMGSVVVADCRDVARAALSAGSWS